MVKKFKGGSRLTTFRLPIEGYKEVRAAMNRVLDSFREGGENPEGETVGDRLVSIVDKANIAELKFMQKESLKETIKIDNKWPTGENPTTKLHVNFDASLNKETKPKITISKELKEKLKELDPKIIVPDIDNREIDNGVIEYPCGCYNDGFYRRAENCKIKAGDHN